MKTNETPFYDASENTTGCCPRFNPAGWDGQKLQFKEKIFVKVSTRSFFHIPVNMGSVFSRLQQAIESANAANMDQFLLLSFEDSPWHADHFYAVDREVPGQNMVRLSGEYLTHVFEGPYAKAKGWFEEMKRFVSDEKRTAGNIYFFYTTCPKCAKAYGKNYVVGVAQMV